MDIRPGRHSPRPRIFTSPASSSTPRACWSFRHPPPMRNGASGRRSPERAFAVHPVQVEPVAWASGLKDVLCGLLSLLAIASYVRYAQERNTAHPKADGTPTSSASWLVSSQCFPSRRRSCGSVRDLSRDRHRAAPVAPLAQSDPRSPTDADHGDPHRGDRAMMQMSPVSSRPPFRLGRSSPATR